MSWHKDYSVSTDFTSGVNPGKLHRQINNDTGVTTPLTGITVNDDVCRIAFESEPSGAEITIVDGLVTGHDATPLACGEKNYLVKKHQKKLLKKETWWNTDNGDGTYSGKVEETEYTYSGNKKKLLSKTITKYWLDGTADGDSVTWTYHASQGDVIIKKS